jgi:hypothetical protein
MKFFLLAIIMICTTRTGSFQISTGVAGTVQNIASAAPAGQTTRFIRFTWNGQTTAVNAVDSATHQRGVGMGINAAVAYPNYCVSTKDQDAVSPSNTSTDFHEIRAIFTILAGSNASDGEARITAYNADGSFDVTIDNQFSAGITVFYTIYASDSPMEMETLVTTEPVAIGTVAMNFSFNPDYLFMLANPSGAFTTGISDDSRMSVGGASFRSGIQQFALSMGSNDNVATTETEYFNRADQFIAHIESGFSGVLNGQANISAKNNNVVTLNWTLVSGGGNREHMVFAVKGGQWFVGQSTTVAAGNPITFTTPFKPKGVNTYSVNRPQNASGVTGNPDEFSMGAFDSSNNARALTTESQNAAATSNVTRAMRFDTSIYVASDGLGAEDSRITLTSVSDVGFIGQQVISDVADRIIYFDAVGDDVPQHIKRDDYTRLRM